MKKIKIYMMFLAVLGLLFTSCSKDDEAIDKTDLATLSFTTVLNDLVANKASLKQQLDIPDCSDDAPVFVGVVLTGETNVGSVDDPVIVSVNPNPDNFDDDPEEEYFTDESSDLQLVPGEYTLEYFVVYNGDPSEDETEVIWIAPREDGEMSNFVDTPLPFTFDIGPGAKKYVDVEVLCFDDRMVNEYGYLFFDLETTQAIEFCVFGNFCDANGRHFPAAFSVSVWEYADDTRGDIIHEGEQNVITTNNEGDFTASTVCLALPDTNGEDEYWVEITLLDSEAYDTEERVIRSGVLTDTQVRELFDGDDDVDYYHFREGNCDSEDFPVLFEDDEPAPDEDTDEDTVTDEEDNCPTVANTDQSDMDADGIGDVCDPDRDGDGIDNEEDGCPDVNPETDEDGDGCEDGTGATDTDEDTIPDEEDNCPDNANTDQADMDGDGIGDVCDPDRDGDGIENGADNCPDDAPTVDEDQDGCEDETSELDTDGDEVPDSIDNCDTVVNPDQTDTDGDGIGDECDPDIDGDEVPNVEDDCPTVVPTMDINEDGCEDPDSCLPEAGTVGSGCTVALFEGESGFVEVTEQAPWNLEVNGEFIGTLTTSISADGSLTVNSEMTAQGGYLFAGYEVWVTSALTGEEILSRCSNIPPGEDQTTSFTVDFGDIDASFPYFVRVKANVCPAL